MVTVLALTLFYFGFFVHINLRGLFYAKEVEVPVG